MFHIFNKKEDDFEVVAFVSGTCIKLEDVHDEVFSKKMMGDGLAIIPEDNIIVSPVDGIIETIFPTKHAVGIKMKDGLELILHIGIDTVLLKGEGFETLIKDKTKVKKGQPLIKIDKDMLEEKGYDLTTLLLFTSGYEIKKIFPYYQQKVKSGDILIKEKK